MPAAAPLDGEAFAALMAGLGPFEPRPVIAVGVSGGADSLALVHLLHAWARTRDGAVVALTVDHGLRPEAAAEARRVAGHMARSGIAHHILTWDGPRPNGDIQAAAREARYRLLEGWCRDAGVVHLGLAHHRDDQAETVLLRLARGSGVSGLAAMSPVVHRDRCRVLRPLLSVPKARLVSTARAMGLDWIEDPSNRDDRYDRARLRKAMPDLAAIGLDAETLADTARRMARTRAALDGAVAELIARAVDLDALGIARIAPEPLRAAPEDVALRALGRVLACVGGTAYPPRLNGLEGLWAALADGDFKGATLGGCHVRPWRDGLVACREARNVAPTVAVGPGETTWDGRFVADAGPDAGGGLTLGALGEEGWAEVKDDRAAGEIPAMARATLPALRRDGRLIAVPRLLAAGGAGVAIRHRPRSSLSQ